MYGVPYFIEQQIRDFIQWTGEPLHLIIHDSFVNLPNPFLIPFKLLVSKTSWFDENNLHSANLRLFSDSKIWRYPVLLKALYYTNLVNVPVFNPISSSEKWTIYQNHTFSTVKIQETGNSKRRVCLPFALWLDHPPYRYIYSRIKMKTTN